MNMLKLTIGDKVYGMRKMPPTLGAFFAPKIAKLVAGMIGNDKFLAMLNDLKDSLPNVDKNDVKVEEQQMAPIAVAISSILTQLDINEVNAIFKEALSYGVYCDNKDLSKEFDFDEVFGENPGHYFPVAIWATYNHVSDFFVGLPTGLQALMTSWRQ